LLILTIAHSNIFNKKNTQCDIEDELNRLKAKAEKADDVDLDKINKQLVNFEEQLKKYKAMFKEKEKAQQKTQKAQTNMSFLG
jgi:archaellum component FlaC